MIHALADIAGADSTVSIAPTSPVAAQWVQLMVTGAGTVRFGDATASITKGAPIQAGGAQFLPYKGMANLYGLATIYAYIPTGATVIVLYDA